MRVARADLGVLLVLILALVASAPFLTRPALPRGTDAELHVYRAAELGRALAEGSGYLRWAPNLYLGYGYPIFNYYSPLTYYLANGFCLIPGFSVVDGVKAVFVLGMFLAAVGSYLLGRELVAPEAGVLAAALFVFSPYVVLIDPHARGDLAEHFAVCLLPLLFHTFHHILTGTRRLALFSFGVVLLAALVFSHNLVGLLGAAMLAAYWLWIVLFRVGNAPRWLGPAAFALAAALIGFFWIPFLLERDAIKLNVVGPGHFDFRQHFLSLGELLASSPILDLGASAPQYAFNLGLPQWILAVAGAVGLLRGSSRRESTFFIVVGSLLVLLMLPASLLLWEFIPPMAYLQFPWRLLGPAGLMLAISGGGVWEVIKWLDSRRAVVCALIAVVLGFALPVLYPPMWDGDFGGTEPQDIIHWELSSQALGTTSTGDFLPEGAALVQMYPAESVVSSYQAEGPVDKINRASLPEGATAQVLEHGPLHDRFLVNMPERFVLRLFTFYFPGWRAYVDGEEVAIDVAQPEGFITLWVPEGQHEVLVRFGDTPARTIGWGVTAAGAVALAVVLVVDSISIRKLRRSPSSESARMSGASASEALSARSFGLLLVAIAAFAAVKMALIDQNDGWMRYTSPPGQAWAAANEVNVRFGDEIELLGYDLGQSSVRAGDTVRVVLYWRALRPVGANYQAFLHLTRPSGLLWAQEDHLNPGGFPTKRWDPAHYVWDAYQVQVPAGTPPGEYELNVGLYLMERGVRLSITEPDGDIVGESLSLHTIVVERSLWAPRVRQLDMAENAVTSFSDCGLTLLGFTQSASSIVAPGEVRVTLFWQADSRAVSCQHRHVLLSDGDGAIAFENVGVPGGYSTDLWRRGDLIRDPVRIILAHEPMVEGRYQLSVAVDGSGQEPVPLTAIMVARQDSE